MGSMTGSAAAKLLLLLLVLAIAGAVASPWLLRSRLAIEEVNAIGTLRRIHAAQAEFYGGSSLYGSMSRLRDSKLLDGPYQDKQFVTDGYKFFHSTDGKLKRFCAEAMPEDRTPGKTYGIDETGIVREFERDVSPCYAGVLQSGGTPLKD